MAPGSECGKTLDDRWRSVERVGLWANDGSWAERPIPPSSTMLEFAERVSPRSIRAGLDQAIIGVQWRSRALPDG